MPFSFFLVFFTFISYNDVIFLFCLLFQFHLFKIIKHPLSSIYNMYIIISLLIKNREKCYLFYTNYFLSTKKDDCLLIEESSLLFIYSTTSSGTASSAGGVSTGCGVELRTCWANSAFLGSVIISVTFPPAPLLETLTKRQPSCGWASSTK